MTTTGTTHRLRPVLDVAVQVVRDGYQTLTTRRYGLIGLSLIRIGYGVTLFALLAVNFPVRAQMWGPQGAYSWEVFERFAEANAIPSLYLLSDSPLFAELIYFATMACALVFALGWRTRATTIVLVALVWSLHMRNPLVTNGGDNLMRLVLFYLCFATTGAYFSLDARRRARRAMAVTSDASQPAPHTTPLAAVIGAPTPSVVTVLHNAALVTAVFQVCVLYLAAGMFKIQGEMWQEGTALYYVLRTADYNVWPEVTSLLYTHPLLVVVGSYAAVFLQVAMPFSLLNARVKHVVMVGLLGMHVSIAVLMGLPFFSLFMIATDVLVITDGEYRRLGAALRRWAPAAASRPRIAARPVPARNLAPAPLPAPAPAPVMVTVHSEATAPASRPPLAAAPM